jgi:hypothetical protein
MWKEAVGKLLGRRDLGRSGMRWTDYFKTGISQTAFSLVADYDQDGNI